MTKRYMLVAEHTLWMMIGPDEGEEAEVPQPVMIAISNDLQLLENHCYANSATPYILRGEQFVDYDRAYIIDLSTGHRIREWGQIGQWHGWVDAEDPFPIPVLD